ncbi:MAG: hypothetical protein JXR64_11335 [Spirochaetales bacterium]|nr:hypothetical protein [Spirochaetales bacterium]
MKQPNCSKCEHFYITLDERFPRACKVFNIKTYSFPSVDVRRLTGYNCPVFKERITKSKEVIRDINNIDRFA